MSVFKPKNSKNYHVRFLHKGSWFRKSAGTSDRKEAERIEKQYRKDYINNRTGIRKDTTLGRALDDWIESKVGTSNYPNLSIHADDIRAEFGSGIDLHDITTAHVTRFVTKLKKKYSNSTIKHRLQTLRSTINYAEDRGYIIPELKYPKLKTVRGRTRVLSDDEILSIENELHPDKSFDNWHVGDEAKRFRQDAYDMWITFCGTGARFTEVSKLEWSQISLKNKTILLYRSKVDNETMLVMTDKVYEVFKRRARRPLSRKFVFPNKKGEARGYTGSAIRSAIKRAGLGSDVSPHVVRHTVATRLLENGLNIQEVQHIMGHADQKTTSRYLHASTQMSAKRAAEVLNQKTEAPKLKVVK